MSEEQREYLRAVAKEVIERFRGISRAAAAAAENFVPLRGEGFASPPTEQNLRQVAEINNENLQNARLLAREPAIARVVVSVEEAGERTYYISRGGIINGIADMASYLSPLGRIAAQPIGTEIVRPDGAVLTVTQRATLLPVFEDSDWDSKSSQFEATGLGTVGLESLRAWLASLPTDAVKATNLLDEMLAEERAREELRSGLRRDAIRGMSLRDQPILDQFQDDIFRLPLQTRLAILGPPGSGKTTTLIRRLAQKCDRQFLEEDERAAVDLANALSQSTHSESWMMFTPTTLLKLYLKEAFARERVPASDRSLWTWVEFRQEIGRSIPGLLRTTNSSRGFILDENVVVLTNDAAAKPIEWFERFDKWQVQKFVSDLEETVRTLESCGVDRAMPIAVQAKRVISSGRSAGVRQMLEVLLESSRGAHELSAELKEHSSELLRAEVNRRLSLDRSFLDRLGTLLQSANESETRENAKTSRTSRTAAVQAFEDAITRYAVARIKNESLKKGSKAARLVEWLSHPVLGSGDLQSLGQAALAQPALRALFDPVTTYFDGLPDRYGEFRTRPEASEWYLRDASSADKLHPFEADVVLLSLLRSASRLCESESVRRKLSSQEWRSVRNISTYFRNQIVVDEVSDFSPIQIACMVALADPHIRSFVACGDFGQRLTLWGARSYDDLEWACPQLERRVVSISYRQSRRLLDFARNLAPARQGAVELPSHFENEGVAPALLENSGQRLIRWLADRIRETERFLGKVPSIAVLVNSEAEVDSVARSLKTELATETIDVRACPRGEVIGRDTCVRVFETQYIKGLEFEAVFFVAVDRLAAASPDMFESFLYVGATRAATYLGISCESALPAQLDRLRAQFCDNWSG